MKKAVSLSASQIKIGLAMFAGLAVFYWLAPAYMKDKITGLVTFATAERQCFNFFKDDFIDPESAYVKSSYVWTMQNEIANMKEKYDPSFDNYEAFIRVHTYAKNRMGGYVDQYLECPLVKGHFDEHAAQMHKHGDKEELNATSAATTHSDSDLDAALKSFEKIAELNKNLAKEMLTPERAEDLGRSETFKNLTIDVSRKNSLISPFVGDINLHYEYSFDNGDKPVQIIYTVHYAYLDNHWKKMSYEAQNSFTGRKTMSEVEDYQQIYPSNVHLFVLKMQ